MSGAPSLFVTDDMVNAATRVLWRSGIIPYERQSDTDKDVVRHMLRAALVNAPPTEYKNSVDSTPMSQSYSRAE
jgi:hypothetical protein